MKCPKCSYLGFETGSRCRNCGYDFSLLSTHPSGEDDVLELPLHARTDDTSAAGAWNDRLDGANQGESRTADVEEAWDTAPLRAERGDEFEAVRASVESDERVESPFPLFAAGGDSSDAPAVRHARRAPLAERRAPGQPRPKVGARSPRVRSDPAFLFSEDDNEISQVRGTAAARPAQAAAHPAPAAAPGARLGAAVIDHAILLAIDFCVVYFTIRIAGLPTAEWRLLPFAPLLGFLVLIKFAYFCTFTAVGGQTIGKMATGLRVVCDDDGWVDGARAVRRTIMGVLSMLVVGLGFLPAILSPDRRALHDRFAGTRVVTLRSA